MDLLSKQQIIRTPIRLDKGHFPTSVSIHLLGPAPSPNMLSLQAGFLLILKSRTHVHRPAFILASMYSDYLSFHTLCLYSG